MIRKFYHLATLLVAGALCWVPTGCVSDAENINGGINGGADGATFSISTRGVGDPDDPSNPDYLDYKIERLRVIAFRGGTVRSNKVYNTTLGATITHTIPAGTYDFVFIANEPSSLTSGLNALQNRTAFEAMSIAAADITRSGLIPQIQEIEGVEVQTGNKVRHDGIGDGNPTTSWPLKLVRLAARIDVALYSKTDIGTVFQGVKLTGLPDRVPLVAESSYTGTAIARTGTMEVKTAANPECFAAVSEEKLRDELPGDIAWSKQVVRLIVPFNEFTPAASAAKSIGMTILLHDRYNPSATMGFDETGTPKDYTLPRNYWLDCDGEVTTPLRLNISTTPWDDKNVNGSTTGLRKLNVSELEPPAALNNYHDKWEVSFWSNQPYVELEATGKWVSAAGETPGTEFTVSDYYDIGFSYDPVTGKGRVVFDLKDLVSAPVGLVQQAVVLRAGSAAVTGAGYLRRELKLSARYLVYAPPGVVGIRKSDGQLTLRGSSTYAGRTERFVTDGEFGELENEPVYVTYYKWGSTIATIGGVGDTFDSGDIVWAPDGYKGTNGSAAALTRIRTEVETGADAAAQWNLVPYGDLDGPSGSAIPAWPATDAAKGLGDICAYAAEDGTGTYRMPSGNPWRNPWRNGHEQYPFGDVGLASSNPWWVENIASGAGTAGVLSTDQTMFLPAAGMRYIDGIFAHGDAGLYWTATPYAGDNVDRATHGQGLNFRSNTMRPEIRNFYADAFAVRCVRDNGLLHAPPGVIGITDKANSNGVHALTLKGSDFYANRPEAFAADQTFGGLEQQPVYVVYYKWGSTVAMIGEVAGINGEDGSFDAHDVVRTGNWTGTPTNAYDSFTSATPTGTLGTGNNIPAANAANGWGDPCAIHFSGSYGGGWKTPAGNPWRGMGNATPFGTIANSASQWWRADIPTGYDNTGGLLSAGGTMFLPAAGIRKRSTGIMGGQGTHGYYWSSTVSSSASSYTLYFYGMDVNPSNSNYFDNGFPVRCVK